MSFKIKKEKKLKNVISNKTIDQIHDEKIQYFDRLQDSLERRRQLLNLKKKPRVCKNCLDTFKKECITCFEKIAVDGNTVPDADFQSKIDDIVSCKEQNDYFLNCNQILLEYYNNKHEPGHVNSLGIVKHISFNDRQEIVRDYYSINNKVYYEKKTTATSVDYCNLCNIEILESSEKYYVCSQCGTVYDKIIDGFSYKDIENYGFISSSFDYKRINYFNEWLNHIQAKEQINIGTDLLNRIKVELHKERITDSSKVSHQKIKKILKSMNEPKLYDHIPIIISKICNIKPLKMENEVVEKLKQMFMAIQLPFEKLKGPNRKNFFSYPYVIYKFCELLGLYEYLPHFQLLKSREKLIKQDILWKNIIQDLKANEKVTGVDWVFIASV